jgi:MFS family permease
MYGPSFFTGHLIARLGLTPVLLTGAALLLACCGINLAGIAEANFWAANLILGIGWNFLFIGGTTLLTRTYRPEERAKMQALNDFLIFGTSTVSSFSSGALLAGSGWTLVQLTVLPFVVVAVAAILWMRWNTARSQPSYASD